MEGTLALLRKLMADDAVVERCAKAGQATRETGKWPMTRAKLAEFVDVLEERCKGGPPPGWAADGTE